jgi:circadian clock protein KaiC
MASVGIDLEQWVDAGLLKFHSFRPSLLGLEAHLFTIEKYVNEFEPSVVVKDPVSSLLRVATGSEFSSLITRQVDFFKSKGITTLLTSLNSTEDPGSLDQYLSSVVDTWLLVQSMMGNGEHNRIMYVLKSRGMAHSNQIREFLLTSQGIELADVYVGPQGVLTGSARQAQEALERSDGVTRLDDLEQRKASLQRKRESVEAQAASLWREFEDEAEAVSRLLRHGTAGTEDLAGQRAEQGRLRRADSDGTETPHVLGSNGQHVHSRSQ